MAVTRNSDPLCALSAALLCESFIFKSLFIDFKMADESKYSLTLRYRCNYIIPIQI